MARNTLVNPAYASSANGTIQQRGAVSVNTQVFWRRVLALALDWLLLTFLQSMIGLGGIISTNIDISNGETFSFHISHQLNWLWVYLLFFAYYFLFEALWGATPGKFIMGLRVVSFSGRRPALWQVAVRSAVRLFEVAPGLFQGVWIIAGLFYRFTRRNQRIGDLVGGVVVADASSLAPSRHLPGLKRVRRMAFAFALVELIAILGLAFSFYIQPLQYAQDWQKQRPDFLPSNIKALYQVSGPVRGQNDQGQQIITYTTYATATRNSYYDSEITYDGSELQRYIVTIVYRWVNPLVGWELDPDSIKMVPVDTD